MRFKFWKLFIPAGSVYIPSQCDGALTKLRVLDFEYICDRIAKFHKKILFITRVINIQILTTKYFSFQYSVTYCIPALRRPAHRARKTVRLLTHETPDFITPALWPANSPDLNPVDCQIWWKLQDRVYCSYVTSTSWSRAWLKSWNISTRWSSIKRSGSGVHVLELAFDLSTRWTFWTQTLDVLKSCHSHGRTLDSQITRVLIVDTICFWVTLLNLL